MPCFQLAQNKHSAITEPSWFVPRNWSARCSGSLPGWGLQDFIFPFPVVTDFAGEMKSVSAFPPCHLPSSFLPLWCQTPASPFLLCTLLGFYLGAVSSQGMAPCSPPFSGFAHGCKYRTWPCNNPWTQTPLQAAGSTRERCRIKTASGGMWEKENTFRGG